MPGLYLNTLVVRASSTKKKDILDETLATTHSGAWHFLFCPARAFSH